MSPVSFSPKQVSSFLAGKKIKTPKKIFTLAFTHSLALGFHIKSKYITLYIYNLHYQEKHKTGAFLYTIMYT